MVPVTDEFLGADFVEWRRRREAELTAPLGWLSVVGLYWLTEQESMVPGLPGRFRVTPEGRAEVRGRGSETVTDVATGQTVQAHTAEVAEGGTLSWVSVGAVLVELIRRSGCLAVRVRDPASPARAAFRGVPTYEVSDRWRVRADFVRLPIPVRVTVGAVRPELTHRYTVIGTVEFELDGARQELLAFGQPDGSALLLFHDPTNGHGTAAWRSLVFRPPDGDGPVVLDFNRVLNLPFVFSAYGTCPRPPDENVITVPVTAGEKNIRIRMPIAA